MDTTFHPDNIHNREKVDPLCFRKQEKVLRFYPGLREVNDRLVYQGRIHACRSPGKTFTF